MTQISALILHQMRQPLLLLLTAYSISILGMTVMPGVDPDGNPWRMSFFHAFYYISFTATTIGYGEIPYELSEAQRAWGLISLYLCVISWLYAIGKILTLIQHPVYKQVIIKTNFIKLVKNLHQPFYIICGFGDTGMALVKAMSERHMQAVVLDNNQEAINSLLLKEYNIHVPGLLADVNHPKNLINAGIQHPLCQGVIGLTNDNEANLKIAVSAKLLRPNIPVICRSDSDEVSRNLSSFDTDHIINPYQTFAENLQMALHMPGLYLLYYWLTGTPNQTLADPPYPPKGLWIVCGYGRFGKYIEKTLQQYGMFVTIIEANPSIMKGEREFIHGIGTEEVTLRTASIENAVAIVAGTDNDSNNLSIIMTAKHIKPELFVIARQNQHNNKILFDNLAIDILMQPGEVIARRTRSLLTLPLVYEFILQAKQQTEEWINILISRICAITNDQTPYIWTVEISKNTAPAIVELLEKQQYIALGVLEQDLHFRRLSQYCIVLLLQRQQEYILLPEANTFLEIGDKILFCSTPHFEASIEWTLNNSSTLNYILTGREGSDGIIWHWLDQKWQQSKST